VLKFVHLGIVVVIREITTEAFIGVLGHSGLNVLDLSLWKRR